MQYNGKELIEITPEKWDNRPRTLLVWGAVNDGYGINSSIHEEYIEDCTDAISNSTNHTIWEAYIDGHARAWYHAAEIPNEESVSVEEEQECKETVTLKDKIVSIQTQSKIAQESGKAAILKHIIEEIESLLEVYAKCNCDATSMMFTVKDFRILISADDYEMNSSAMKYFADVAEHFRKEGFKMSCAYDKTHGNGECRISW